MTNYLIILKVLFILIDFVKAQPYTCVHDQVSPPNVPVGTIKYQDIIKKRHLHKEDKYQPLRIYPYIDEFDVTMTGDVMQTIDHALRSVTQYLEGLIKVERTFNPFLLERTSCVQKWKTGRNHGKCSKAKVTLEFCSMQDTDYVISERFLHGLEVYDENGVYPALILPKGDGVMDVNFFLFLTSKSTSWCKKPGVHAYGSYCRLDSHNRPVAGLINLCPDYFSRKFYSTSFYVNVLMHEMLHILGFSSRLFPKFKTCVRENVCHTPKKIAVTDKHGVQRLVLPNVVTAMQNHLNCSDEDLGGPLEKTDSKEGYSSHWHPLLMYTSIMVPVILDHDFTVIDNITLALLASTGWYHVNFTRTRPFAFGKNQGCDFGFKDNCEDSSHLCTTSNAAFGCDLLHYTIGLCEKITPTHPCGVYRYNASNRCKDVVGSFRGTNIRNSYHEHRCIMRQNVNETKFEPTCMLIKCRQHRTVDLYLNSTWVPCEPNTLVTSENITAKCLHPYAICNAPNPRKNTCVFEDEMALSVRIYLTDPSFEKITSYSDFKDFKILVKKSSTCLSVTSSIFSRKLHSVTSFNFMGLPIYLYLPLNTQSHHQWLFSSVITMDSVL